MQKSVIAVALVAITLLAGCMQDPTSRGLAGAVAGAAIADSMDENMVAGAALGGLAGAASCNVVGGCY